MPTNSHPTPGKIAYADCFSGASGDMLLAALLDAGLDEQLLRQELGKLAIGPFELRLSNATPSGIKATRVEVIPGADQQFRHLDTLLEILRTSSLHPKVITTSSAVLTALAQAEAKVHGLPIEAVHFHEVGAVDTIVDVVGVVAGLHLLGITRLICSPLPWPRGFVNCAHGRLPLPAPAVCELLTGAPVYPVELTQELVTPTGAALLATLATDFGPLPAMTIEGCGYGAGSQTLENGQPNLLRLIIGQPAHPEQEVEIIETHLDDWNSEGFPHLCDLLLQQGALDVSLTPMLMKKGRPGQLLRIICFPAQGAALKQTILNETTAIGLRFHRQQRLTLPRQQVEIDSPWGKMMAKQVQAPTGAVIYPEYEECRRIALEAGIPLQQVYHAVYRIGEAK